MLRKLVLLGCLSLPASAQLQLFQFDGTTETPVVGVYQVPGAAPGDTLETRFRVRNPGSGPATLQTLSIAGQGFRISATPTLPYVIASGQFADFKVTFSPDAPGFYSANLQVNGTTIYVRGTATPAATLSLGNAVLAAGATVDFGGTEHGVPVSQSFTVSNPSNSVISIASISVSGSGFQGPVGVSTALSLSPGQAATFQIVFAPQSAGTVKGQLTIDQRSFILTGLGLDPPLPKASIVLNSQAGQSAQQAAISILLASASKVNGIGTLTLDFKPSVAGVTDDPAIQFLSGPKRVATVTIAPGDSAGKFGALAQLGFQTGTTAGTITFTLKFPNGTQQMSVTIAAAPISFDTATGTRRVSDLDVSLIGFDNTHSASQLSFTFYGPTGQALAPGAIKVDETSDFRAYFNSTQAVGGAFLLRATFPVTGDATQVKGVDVEVTNSAGIAKTQRITF